MMARGSVARTPDAVAADRPIRVEWSAMGIAPRETPQRIGDKAGRTHDATAAESESEKRTALLWVLSRYSWRNVGRPSRGVVNAGSLASAADRMRAAKVGFQPVLNAAAPGVFAQEPAGIRSAQGRNVRLLVTAEVVLLVVATLTLGATQLDLLPHSWYIPPTHALPPPPPPSQSSPSPPQRQHSLVPVPSPPIAVTEFLQPRASFADILGCGTDTPCAHCADGCTPRVLKSGMRYPRHNVLQARCLSTLATRARSHHRILPRVSTWETACGMATASPRRAPSLRCSETHTRTPPPR